MGSFAEDEIRDLVEKMERRIAQERCEAVAFDRLVKRTRSDLCSLGCDRGNAMMAVKGYGCLHWRVSELHYDVVLVTQLGSEQSYEKCLLEASVREKKAVAIIFRKFIETILTLFEIDIIGTR